MKLDVFIKGEMIDLCVPTREFAEKSNWYSWFNDSKINRFLDQGLWPNNQTQQVEFFEKQGDNRLMLIISNRTDYMGVVSLSELDLVRKRGVLSIVTDARKDVRNAPLIALEAIARISEHGFKTMGLSKIMAGQHMRLAGWQQRMELLGYRVEGVNRQGFVKGREIADEILIGATYADYKKIVELRGNYWDSAEKMAQRIKDLPKEKFVDKLYAFQANDGEHYYDALYR
ncbi:GNAT family N-acetyltransferase [Candidatus Margulisiibacteriota bacterium]